MHSSDAPFKWTGRVVSRAVVVGAGTRVVSAIAFVVVVNGCSVNVTEQPFAAEAVATMPCPVKRDVKQRETVAAPPNNDLVDL